MSNEIEGTIYCCLTHYYKLSILKQHALIISQLCVRSPGMAQLDPLFWVSQGCNQSVGWNVLIWRFTFRQEVESCPNLLRLLKELISLWLYDRGLKCFAHGCLRPLSCPRKCLHVLETTYNSLSCGLPNMDVYSIRPARRISSSGQL